MDEATWPRFPDLRGPFVSGFCTGTDPDDETGQRWLSLTYDGVPIEIIPAGFARQLEAERDRATRELDELKARLEAADARIKELERPTHLCEHGRAMYAPDEADHSGYCTDQGTHSPGEIHPVGHLVDAQVKLALVEVDLEEAESRLDAADRLAEVVEALPECGCSPAQSDALNAALRVYRAAALLDRDGEQ